MVSTSKILTVSYGTFSCTLEGFDDSFETMKAIAEYFRDLAADDRYFGAEPPTPDAEMLARIAEREVARRVEAHEDQGRIHLRAEQVDASAGAAVATGFLASDSADAPKEKTEPTADPAELQTEDLSVEREPSDVEELTDTTSPEAEMAESEVDLQELGASQDMPAEEEITETPEPVAEFAGLEGDLQEPAEAGVEEVQATDFVKDVEAFEQPQVPVEETLAEENPVTEEPVEAVGEFNGLDPDIAAFMEDVTEDDMSLVEIDTADFAEEPGDLDTIDEIPVIEVADVLDNQSEDDGSDATIDDAADVESNVAESDDIADKLQRIRAVAAENEPEFAQQSFTEDEHAEDLMEAEDPAAELEALLGSSSEEPIEAPQLDRAFETLEEAFAEDEDDDLEDAEVIELETQTTELEPADPIEEAEFAQLLADATADSFVDDASETPQPEMANVEAEQAEPFVLSHDDRIEAERVEIVEDETVQNADKDFHEESLGESTLSPQEEADLMRELAEVDAEMADTGQPEDKPKMSDEEEAALLEAEEVAQTALDMAEARDNEEKPNPEDALKGMLEEPQQKPRGLERLLGMRKREPEEDIERLFDETDVQMEDEQATLRRNAIQHLRAAVAATRAERKAGGKIEEDVDDTPYRSDLAEVVRPRRPSATESGSRRPTRPEDISPAPLKLVAEQRVDVSQNPVRPRRVSAQERAEMAKEASEAKHGFAVFAEEMGATELPEILEAAAAYMSDVEGRSEFSRPMLMNKLKEVRAEEFSREDGLRSFGELLRGGKLRKIRGGRFSVTEDTEFRSDARDAS